MIRLRILSVLGVTTLAIGLACSSCGSPLYGYAPVTTTTTSAELEGVPAADYAIPAGSPHGDVRLAMLGVPELEAGPTESATFRAIRITMYVANRSGEVWTVDPSEQRATLIAEKQRSDVYATTPEITRPQVVDIPTGESRQLDLFFALPVTLQKAKELPSFTVTWTVHAGARLVASQSTAFQRFVVEYAPPPPPPQGPSTLYPIPEIEEALPGSEPPERQRPWLPVEPLP